MITNKEDAKTALNWWCTLSINEQKAFKLTTLGSDFPNSNVLIDHNLIQIWRCATKTKSEECRQVLQLMDKDFSYIEALTKVITENKLISKSFLEKELDLYI